MRRGRFTLIPAGVLLLGACSSAVHRIDRQLTTPDAAGRSYHNLLVIGAYEDRAFRVGSETAFVEELKARGLTASVSYNTLTDLKALGDSAALQAALASTDHDAVLTVATIDEGYDYGYGDYLETRGLVTLLGGEPGAGTDLGAFISWAGAGQYQLFVGLWDARTQQPVWEITTNSASTGSESEDLKALADFVVKALRERGLVQHP